MNPCTASRANLREMQTKRLRLPAFPVKALQQTYRLNGSHSGGAIVQTRNKIPRGCMRSFRSAAEIVAPRRFAPCWLWELTAAEVIVSTLRHRMGSTAGTGHQDDSAQRAQATDRAQWRHAVRISLYKPANESRADAEEKFVILTAIEGKGFRVASPGGSFGEQGEITAVNLCA